MQPTARGNEMLFLIQKMAAACENEVVLLQMLGKHGDFEACMNHYAAEGDKVIAGQKGIRPWRGLRAMKQVCQKVWLDGCSDIYGANLRWD